MVVISTCLCPCEIFYVLVMRLLKVPVLVILSICPCWVSFLPEASANPIFVSQLQWLFYVLVVNFFSNIRVQIALEDRCQPQAHCCVLAIFHAPKECNITTNLECHLRFQTSFNLAVKQGLITIVSPKGNCKVYRCL